MNLRALAAVLVLLFGALSPIAVAPVRGVAPVEITVAAAHASDVSDGNNLRLRAGMFCQLWTPRNLATGDYWMANNAARITITSGRVSSWKSEIYFTDALQGTAGSRPTYSDTAFNSRPAIVFDGLATYNLTTATLPTGFPSGTAEGWIWVVSSQDRDAAVTGQTVFGGWGTTAGGLARLAARNVSSAKNVAQLSNGSSLLNANSTTPALTGEHILLYRFLTGSSIIYQDGAQASNTNSMVINSADNRFRIGANLAGTPAGGLTGNMWAIGATGALTTDERDKLTGWAAWASGKQANLPVTQPYFYGPPLNCTAH